MPTASGFQPDSCFPGQAHTTSFEIGESRNLRLANQADQAKALLAVGPALAIHTLISLLGIGLFILWLCVRGRELLLCSGFLLTSALLTFCWEANTLRILVMPWRVADIVFFALFMAAMSITVEFTWTVLGLRARALKRIAQAALQILNTSTLYGGLATSSSTTTLWILNAGWVSVLVFGQILIWTGLWSALRRRKSWPIALALVIYPIAAMMNNLGFRNSWTVGSFDVSLNDLGVFASSLLHFVMLGQRAWKAWRVRDELRAEFDAARAIQQRLVAPPGDIPGFNVESV